MWRDPAIGVETVFKVPPNEPETAADLDQAAVWHRPSQCLDDLALQPLQSTDRNGGVQEYWVAGGCGPDARISLVLDCQKASASHARMAKDFCANHAAAIALVLTQSVLNWRLNCLYFRIEELLSSDLDTRLLVDRNGRVCCRGVLTSKERKYVDRIFRVRDGVLRCRVARDTPRFLEAIDHCLNDNTSVAFRPSMSDVELDGVSVIIRTVGEKNLRQNNGVVRFERMAELVISDVRQSRVTAEHLRDLFGLTRVESEIGASLVHGISPADYATKAGTKVATVRWHVRNIFRQTDCRTQAEFVALALRRLGNL